MCSSDLLRLLLLPHIRLMLIVDEVDYGCPTVPVVHVVTESGAVNDGQLSLELFFLQLRFDDLNFGQLVQLLVVTLGVVLRWRQLCREQGIDKRRLPKTRFP